VNESPTAASENEETPDARAGRAWRETVSEGEEKENDRDS
jgi:hypothetical protein